MYFTYIQRVWDKTTFNLNSGGRGEEQRVDWDEISKLYAGHEVAARGYRIRNRSGRKVYLLCDGQPVMIEPGQEFICEL